MKKALLFFLTAVTLTACTPPATTDGGTTVPADSSLAAADSTPSPQPVDSTTAVADNGEGSDAGNTGTTPTPKVDNGNNTATDAGNTGGGRVRDPNLANTKMFKVTGNILVAGSYCGGAAPSKEMEEEARRPKPFANQGFLIRAGKMNALGTAMATRTRTRRSAISRSCARHAARRGQQQALLERAPAALRVPLRGPHVP